MTWLAVLLALAPWGHSGAEPSLEDTARYVAALRARTGELLWENRSLSVERAAFSLYERELVVHARQPGKDEEVHVALNPSTGTYMEPLGDARGRVLAASRSIGASQVRFDNGWEIVRFDKGFDRTFRFVNHEGERVWNLHTGVYPDLPVAIGRTIVWNEGSYSGSLRVHAQRLGAEQALWSQDLAEALDSEPAEELQLHRLGEDVFAQTAGQLLLLDVETGAVRRRWDFRPHLSGVGASGVPGLGTLSRDDDTLIVAYPRKLFALDRATGQLLWRMDPESFPSKSGLLVFEGVVYLVRGEPKIDPQRATKLREG